MGVHGSREAPSRLALRGELVEAMPQWVFMGVARHLPGLRCKGSSWRPCPKLDCVLRIISIWWSRMLGIGVRRVLCEALEMHVQLCLITSK